MLSRLAGGRYELEAVLGEGGMASVWRALDTRLGRSVAIKMLKESAEATELQRLAEEARTVARLVHPNIVAVFDLGSEQGVPYLVMELVNGDSLRQRLTQGPLPISQVLEIGGQVCDALVAAHRAGVVHRDIKPDNILLTAADVVKICDFGVAHLQPGQSAAGRVAGTTEGTSGYMAPEQAVGGPVDARTDLYALGCVLYAMLTGSSPFTGTDPTEVALRQARQAAPRVASSRPDVSPQLDAFVAELLAQDPADRPATTAAARERLAEIADAQVSMNESIADPTAADPSTAGEPATAPPAWASAVPTKAHPTKAHSTKAHSTKGAQRAPLASARAAVVTRTQSMPAVDVDDRAAPTAGIRLGPAGIAGVAIGAAALTAVIIAAIMLGQSAQQVAAATTTSGPTSSGAISPTPTAATGVLDTVRTAVTAQIDSGRLERGKAKDLLSRLDEIEGYLAEGATGKAVEKIAEFRRVLAELRRDHNLSNSGYRAIVNSLNRSDLPDEGDDRGGRGGRDDD